MTDSSHPSSASEMAESYITIRSIVTTKEAGTIIGKSGQTISDIRKAASVTAGVSPAAEDSPDRVLSVTGTLQNVAEAYFQIAKVFIDSEIVSTDYPFSMTQKPPPGIATLRLLVSHLQMGAVIGKKGLKIRALQEKYKVRMVASKDILPQSTERIVEIQGRPDGLKHCLFEIGFSLLEDWERSKGTIPYLPRFRPLPEIVTETIAIKNELVGAIIGKNGTKITRIRALSGAKISIGKTEEGVGERIFTIIGTKEANKDAIKLLERDMEKMK